MTEYIYSPRLDLAGIPKLSHRLIPPRLFMSVAERMPLAESEAQPKKVAPESGKSAALGEPRLLDEAFEQAKRNAMAQTKGGGFIPDYVTGTDPLRLQDYLTPRPNPWLPRPGQDNKNPEDKIPQPGSDNKPIPPVPGPIVPNPGEILRPDPNTETTASKIAREAMVIGGGVGQSFFYGVANLPEHLPQIASSVVIGGTLAAMSKAGKLGATTALVVGAYFTSRFVLDSINDTKRWEKFSGAVKDTWQSDANFWKNMHTVRDTAGNYVFDTTLSLGSGYVGYKNPKLGEWILAILRVPPIVPNAPPPFNPRVVTTGMYMSIMPPAGFYRHYDDRTPFAPSSWSFDIHGSIRRNPGHITRTPNLIGPNKEQEEENPNELYYRRQLRKANQGQ